MVQQPYTRRVGELILVPPGWVLEHSMPTAVDPPGCGCTECQTGEYVPVDEVSDEILRLMLQGNIRNNTGLVWVRDPFGRLD